jgi:outer membrane biosynthesis protein TonB
MKASRAVLLLLLVGAAVGVGLGFLVGWGLWPVQYYDTDPVDLKEEHKEEYVVLVGAAYALNGNLEQAKDRLAKLEEEDVAQVVADVAQRYLEEGRDLTTTRNLVMLADALGSSTAVMLAYVATPTPVPTFTPTATEVPTETPTEIPTVTPTVAPSATPVPPTPTSVPATATSTRVPPTSTVPPATSTPQGSTSTSTTVPPTATSTVGAPTNTATATSQPAGSCPGRPGITVRDIGAAVRDWGWLTATFGGVSVQQAANCPGGAVYAVETLWESHDVALRATVLDGSGNRMPNVPVAFFGFGATVDTPGACRPNATVVYTNQDGEANMVMGWGSAYIPPAAGYHAVWVMDSAGSDCVTGLGMVDYTEHQHLNVTFRLISH